MNWADYVILATLALSVLMGLWRGLVGEVWALIVWVVAIWVAWRCGPFVSAAFTAVDLPSARVILGYAACFITVLIFGGIVGYLLRRLVASSGLRPTDRLFGALFGLARGLFLLTLTVLLLGFTPFTRDPWWHDSRLLPAFQNSAQWALAHLPTELTQYLDLRTLLLPAPPPSPAASPAPAPAPAPNPEPKKT